MGPSVDRYYDPLPRSEIIKAIEHKFPARIPMVRAKWWGEGLEEQYGSRLLPLERYPEDIVQVWLKPLEYETMNLPWTLQTGGAKDSVCVIDNWDKLDDFISRLPDPDKDTRFEALYPEVEQAHRQGRYLTFSWWGLFFERPRRIRGMENLLTDYYLYPEQVHRLNESLCNLYLGYLRRAIREFQPDGFWASDDLGHQTGLFMRPLTFRQFLKPYYMQIGQVLKTHKIHWWFHSCGNNTGLLGDLIEAGVNVFHPVQRGTMNEIEVARTYGDRLTFLVGIDVQHILQEQDAAGVRSEVRHLIDVFDRPEGGMCMSAGNGIVEGTPFENIEAFLDESYEYGLQHRSQHNRQPHPQ
jgi:uroporphyrinogen decarboxylase